MIINLGYNPGRPEYNPYMDTFEYFYISGDHGKNYLTSEYEKDRSHLHPEGEKRFYEYSFVN